MAYTFGGATTDDITWNVSITVGANSQSLFVYGWWLPTTLTATRGLWSIGNTIGAEIDSTTDELRLRSDNTTDGQWTTTGVDLAVGVPTFLAFFATFNNTGPAVAWRVWRGDMMTPPVACTIANPTAPSGNNTGSASFFIGNKGTGSLAFQGEIAHVGGIFTDRSTASVVTHPFGLVAHGAVTANEELNLLERFVTPAWAGDMWWLGQGLQKQGLGGTGIARWHTDLGPGAVPYGTSATASNMMPVAPTINGATWAPTKFGRGPQQFAATVL